MTIGTTTFGFRYQLLDPARAPALIDIVDQARALGLDALQICENARPIDLGDAEWRTLVSHAGSVGLRLGVGCKTTDAGVFRRYLDRAEGLPGRMLRLVFEEEQGQPPGREQVARFLEQVVPLLEQRRVRLAIENHFDIASRILAEEAAPYPADLVGFCVDTANSLRNFETPEVVMDLLGPRAFCYHLKDYRVDGHLLGFQVGGAPLGAGRLQVDSILDAIFARNPEPEIYVKNWVPPSGDWRRDVEQDEIWLRAGLGYLRPRLEARAANRIRH